MITDFHHHHGFGQGHGLIALVLAALYRDAVALYLKELRAEAKGPAGEQFKAGLRAVIGVALILTQLDLIKNTGKARVFGVGHDPRRGQPGAQVRTARPGSTSG